MEMISRNYDHQQQLPPGKTPELLADFVNEQPMKVFTAIILPQYMLNNVKNNISNDRSLIQKKLTQFMQLDAANAD